MSEQNKMLARRVFEEVVNRGNFAAVAELYAGDYAGHQRGSEANGHEGVTQYFGTLREAFPDIHLTIEDQVAEGDRVATRWTASATHQGQFMGVPPTGKPGVVTGVTINRIANGKITEGWTNMDTLGLLQQIGALPTPA